MGLRKNLLTQSPPRPPWARRTFRRWPRLDLPPPKQGCCSAGGGLVAYAKALCQMSKCGEGEELVFIRGLYDVVPNVEMWELEKEMDKDGSVVFRVGWATR